MRVLEGIFSIGTWSWDFVTRTMHEVTLVINTYDPK